MGHQDQKQGVGAAGAAYGVPHAAELSQAAFQFGDLLPHDEVSVPQDALDAPFHLRADAGPLGLEIDEGNHAERLPDPLVPVSRPAGTMVLPVCS